MRLIFLVHLVIFYQISAEFSANFGRLFETIFDIYLFYFSGQHDVAANVNDDGTARFFVVGDWGGLPFLPYETPSEVAVAEAMGKMGKNLNTSFQLALGDNFYFEGVQSPTDSRFQVKDRYFFERDYIFIYSLAYI
jgi:hypothetical protein